MFEMILFLVIGCAIVLIFNYAAGNLNEKYDRDSLDFCKRLHDDAERCGMEDKLRDSESSRSKR